MKVKGRFGLHTDRIESNGANLLLYHSRFCVSQFLLSPRTRSFFGSRRGRTSDGGERNNPLNLSSFSSSSLEGETFTSIMIVLLGSAEIGAR